MKSSGNLSCLFCGASKLYRVSKTQYRCATCKQTWSAQKAHKETLIIEAFVEGLSINAASSFLQLNYATVQKRYASYRSFLVQKSEVRYQSAALFSEYDEYYYLPTSKKGNPRYIFDAVGILGMLCDKGVYTLLLPDHFESLKQNSCDLEEKEAYAKYLQHHKIARLESFDSRLSRFWIFLETFMHRFKGVDHTNFIYYLKEAEFRFNHTKEEQRQILGQINTYKYRYVENSKK